MTRYAETWTLPSLVSAERRQRGWTRAATAERLGLSPTFYGEIESGKRGVSQATLRRLFIVFGPAAGLTEAWAADRIETARAKRVWLAELDWGGKFWSLVHPEALSGCWLWHGSVNADGYGRASVNGRRMGAHRHSYEIVVGPVPDGLVVCHRCDVPACVNPSHLFLGTHTDNMRDMFAKGRRTHATGDRNGSRVHPGRLRRGSAARQSKMTEATVAEARERRRSGESFGSLACRYGVTKAAIMNACTGKTWRHVDG